MKGGGVISETPSPIPKIVMQLPFKKFNLMNKTFVLTIKLFKLINNCLEV